MFPGHHFAEDQVYIRDRHSRVTEEMSVSSSGEEGRGFPSSFASIAANGHVVGFSTQAKNFVDVDLNGHKSDVFIHTR